MSLRSCLRIAPLTLNHIFRQQSLVILNHASKIHGGHNLARPVVHVRFFSSKTKAVNENGEAQRIYYGILTPHIRAVKWFSLTTSVCGMAAQPFIFKELSELQSTPLVVVACSFIGFFTFVTPLLLHYITKKYVTHLDYIPDRNTYVATTVNFFCLLKKIEFTPDDVKVPDVPGMFTTFLAKGTPLFLDSRLFDDPGHYIRIMGYDKPMDFKLCESSTKEIKDKKV